MKKLTPQNEGRGEQNAIGRYTQRMIEERDKDSMKDRRDW